MRIAAVALLVPCLVVSVAAQGHQIAGDVFIVTKGGTNYKLGLVTVTAIPEAAIKKYLRSRKLESEAEILKIRPETDSAEIESRAAAVEYDRLRKIYWDDVGNQEKQTASEAAKSKRDESQMKHAILIDKQRYFSSAAFVFDGLPKGVSSAKTDADGRFAIHIPPGRFGIAARSSRQIGDTQAALKMRNRTVYQDFGLMFAKEDADLQTPEAKLGQPVATLARRVQTLAKEAGVKRVKFHGVRHTVATLSLEAGTPPHVVAARLGHSVMELMKTYAHALPGQQQDAAARLGQLLHG